MFSGKATKDYDIEIRNFDFIGLSQQATSINGPLIPDLLDFLE